MAKRLISLLLTAVIVLSLAGVTVFASEEAEEIPETFAPEAEEVLAADPETVAAEEEGVTEPVPVVMEETSLLPAGEESESAAGESPEDAAEEPAEETEVQALTAGIQQEEEVLEDTIVYVNPLYADVLTEADIQEAAAAIEAENGGIAPLSTVYYTTKEDAGAYL